MSRRARLALFAVAAAALAVTLGVGLAGLPSFGSQLTAYARMLNDLAPRQRHVTDVVSAITFDYRGIDTLFEEFILLAAVAGISVLLRPFSDEARELPEDKAPDRRIPPPSPAVWLLAVVLSSLLVLAGLETVTHGVLTPGGGFQAGVILASALYVVYPAPTTGRSSDTSRPRCSRPPTGRAPSGTYSSGCSACWRAASSSATSSAWASPGT
jgi:multicomponent Na+:H+ antiporter subunit B